VGDAGARRGSAVALPLPTGTARPANGAQLDRAGNYKQEGQHVTVADYDFAAFLLMKGVPLVEATKLSEHTHSFVFLDQTMEGKSTVATLAITFANSESARFAEAIRRLKKTIYSRRPR